MFKSADYVAFKNTLPAGFNAKECPPFNVKVPLSKNWRKAKKKILFVIEHVDTEDLRDKVLDRESGVKEGKLLTHTGGVVLETLIDFAKKGAKPFLEEDTSYGYAAINFNFFKTYHLKSDEYASALQQNAKRVRKFIQRIDPDMVVIFGDSAAESLLDVPNVLNKRGWVHQMEIGDKTYPTVNTLSFHEAYSTTIFDDFDADDEDDGENESEAAIDKVNILGYISRNVSNAFVGKLPFDLSHIRPNCFYVDTIDKFKKLMKKMWEHNGFGGLAVDTETANLNRITNQLLMFQCAFDEERGYVLPIYHKDTPFNNEELEYIISELRKFFMQQIEYVEGEEQYLIMQGGKFDMIQLREALGIPVFFWPVWDTIAGEFCLDENLKVLRGFGTPAYGLDQIFCTYGNDFYYNAEFSKGDRKDFYNADLNNKYVRYYCAIDVQSLIGIHKMQLNRSRYEKLGSRPYYRQYKKLVLTQMSNIQTICSVMEHRGIKLDINWLFHLKSKQSPINIALADAKKELYAMESVQKANKILMKEMNIPTKGLFGDADTWVFDIGKPKPKQILFIDVLGLEPLTYGTDGETASIDKGFQTKYKEVPEVALLTRINKLAKLKSSYVNAFARKISESEDGRKDQRLRPNFDFKDVVTGRGNSSNPSLQQIPQRTVEAKYVKRMFVAPMGCLFIKMDYNAHEVRMWSIFSGDKLLGDLFNLGRELRKKFRLKPSKDLEDAIYAADIHRKNYEFFFGIPSKDVDKDQRDSVKSVAFGAIYGKGAKSLAKDIKKAVEFAEKLLSKFFKRFKKAAGWLEWAKKHAREHLHVFSPIGRKRNLFGYMTGLKSVMAAMDRRAMNSPIQGGGADIGHSAANLYMKELYKFFLKLGRLTEEDTKMLDGVNCMVHDAIETEAQYRNFLVCLQILQWCATIGVMHYYRRIFGMKFTVPFEIEFEIGATASKMYKWDFSEESLKDIIYKSLCDQRDELKYDIDPDKVMKIIYKDRKNEKLTKYLDKHYPYFDKWIEEEDAA